MKKKHLFIILALVLPFIGAKAQTVKLGDANGDGVINIADVTTTTAIILGKTTAIEVETAESLISSNSLSGTFTIGGETKTYINGVEVRHEYVDLGLPSGTLWATCNIGSDSPEVYGEYFAWGETTGYTSGDGRWFEYKYYNLGKSETELVKYCTNSQNGTVDNLTTLEPSDDAATVNWGDSWRIPTKTEWQELVDNCTWTKTFNPVGGCIVTGKNGNSIFLPASGDWEGEGVCDLDDLGNYWSSSLDTDHNGYAYGLFFNVNTDGSDGPTIDSNERDFGWSIRPVLSAASLKTKPTCTFANSTYTLGINETYTQALTTNSDGAVTYSSDDESVATVDATTGQVTAVATGTATITATVAATDSYQSATVTYTVTVGNASSGHEYVDLGLPSGTLWATCNVGATSATDCGLYFAWGETTGYENADSRTFDWTTYKWTTNHDWEGINKYQYDDKQYSGDWYDYNNNFIGDNLAELEAADDAATANWGGSWRMPTEAEWTEIFDYCDMTETTQNGIKGMLLTSRNTGNSIFIPASGYCFDDKISSGDTDCYCWTSTPVTNETTLATAMMYEWTSGAPCIEADYRYCGLPVRPVLSAESLLPKPTGTFSISIAMGSTFKMPLTTNSDGYVYYSSSNTDVASVNENTGEVTADAAGEAVITAYVESDGSFKTAEFSYKLTVLPNKGDINSGYTDEQYSKKR